jgi:hypothetical protein
MKNLQKEYSNLIFRNSKDAISANIDSTKVPEISPTKRIEIPTTHSFSPTENRRVEIVNFAQKYLGTPYLVVP